MASVLGQTPDNRCLHLWVAHDITSRKQAERTQQLLMGELNHRVKNTLATVQAIAQQTLRHNDDPAQFAISFTGRIQALSSAHSMLSDATWKGADMRELIRDQMSLGAIDERRISVTGPAIRLEPQHALYVALMLHELATNANKYGALSQPEGTIAAAWSVLDDQLKLTWVERGGPRVCEPARRGFGTTLIEQTARADGGDARVDYDEKGVSWEITLPYCRNGSLKKATVQPIPSKNTARQAAPRLRTSLLTGKRFLVVEDEPLVALSLVSSLEEAGAQIAGPATTAAEALEIIAHFPLDGALLDGNLHGQPVDAIAAALTGKNIPFMFVTGYGRESLPTEFKTVKILGKPFTDAQLLDAAMRIVEPHAQKIMDAAS